MRRFLLGLFAAIGVLSVLGVVAVIGLSVVLLRLHGATPLPGDIVLTADLTGGLTDGPSGDALSKLVLGNKATLRDFVDALDRAGNDPRVKALFIQLGDDSMALAKTQQVRDSIAAFRAKGKVAVAFADSFGEGSAGTRPYYLATACDEIWLQPLGALNLTGLRSETPFIRGLLDKLGIVADFEHREEFKTAMNSLTETAMTAPQREEVAALLTSMSAQIDRGIAAARGLTPDKVAAIVDRAPLSGVEAKALGLVTRLGYRDEALASARAHGGGEGAKFVSFTHYLKEAGRPHASGSKIALIFGTGLITRGGTPAGISGETDFSAHELARAFAAASRDKDVRAILFRIDSPGGSATASETIWREVMRARGRGKPVVVSMGDVAASGGYYVAAPADKIVAEPATLTGSIGVLAGKLVFEGLMAKLGIAADAVERGANAGMFSITDRFSDTARQRLSAMLDETYAGFKDRVASGRHMTAEAVEGVAKGRVWTGEDAKANGLVDALGGYETALALVRQAAKLAPDAPIDIVVYPRERGLMAALLGRLRDTDDDDEAAPAGTLQRGFAVLGLAADTAARLADPGLLRMPPLGDIR
ncbi:MAG TPA: signal peptide peptidase SppA [Stellaceae bacterium]|nr:signal peptide peptidase SppA [Stellaceae bacterium]